MKTKYFVGLDPSFTAFGMSLIDTKNKKLVFNQFSVDIDRHSTISKFNAIKELRIKLEDFLKSIIPDFGFEHCTSYGLEVTTVYTGYFALELFALDFHLYYFLNFITYTDYMLYSPSTITKVTGHKSSAKEKTIFLIEDHVIPLFEKYGYTVEKMMEADTKEVKVGNRWQKRRTITDGEADSFIYALHRFYLFSEDSELKNELIELLPKLADVNMLS